MFDLSPYMGGYNENPNDYYCVKDSLFDTDPDRKYQYCFNVCTPVKSIPKACNDIPDSKTCKLSGINETTCEDPEKSDTFATFGNKGIII